MLHFLQPRLSFLRRSSCPRPGRVSDALLFPQVGGCAERSHLSYPGSSAMALLAYLKSLFILQLLMGFVFVVSGLIINFIQLCTCVLWPINKQLYRRINCRLSYSLWSREYTFLSQNTPEDRPQLVDDVFKCLWWGFQERSGVEALISS